MLRMSYSPKFLSGLTEHEVLSFPVMSCMWPWPLVVNEICFWKLMFTGSLCSVKVKIYFQADVYGNRLTRLVGRLESPH